MLTGSEKGISYVVIFALLFMTKLIIYVFVTHCGRWKNALLKR